MEDDYKCSHYVRVRIYSFSNYLQPLPIFVHQTTTRDVEFHLGNTFHLCHIKPAMKFWTPKSTLLLENC